MKKINSIIILIISVFVAPICINAQTYTLNQVKDSALKNNLTLKNADISLQQSRQTQKEAFTNYFPQVSATGGAFKANKDLIEINMSQEQMMAMQNILQTMPSLGAFVPQQSGYIDDGIIASVSAVQPIFAGGRIINGNKLARVGLEADSLKYNLTKNEINLLSETYFWQVVNLENKLKTVDAAIEMLNSIKRDVNLAVKAGIRTNNDVLQVDLKLNEMAVNKIRLEDGLKLSKMLLAQHMGVAFGEDMTLVYDCTQVQTELLNADVTNTNEYQLLKKNVEAKELLKKIETGSNLPSVAVGAAYAYNNLMDKDYKRGFVFATVSVPISDWWGGSHRIKKKNLEIIAAQNELEDNTQKLQLRIRQTYNEMSAATKQVQVMQKSVEQAEENLRNHQNFFKAGTVTMSDLLQSQMLLVQSQNDLQDAKADLQIKTLKYRQAVGAE
ncbi:MAG: TolC family protein [Bacteroidales bacterium]|nr:TolC family protein [Bacteroidales bacterium]